ncbi:hypothetical protein BKA62DRAFT_676285 [Auriculariales sp. MPI-PUGE-AT-0066]|nr:hypothetical protein BKA62DRAFT_676285 [Auriculariales sp. MPI-PUGE-AT-0066]
MKLEYHRLASKLALYLKPIAKYCATFIADLGSSPNSEKLVDYIVWSIRRTRLRAWRGTACGALILLGRLKEQSQIVVGGSVWRSGRRVWILAFMLAGKSLVDNCFDQQAWAEMAKTMMTREMLDRLEREWCRTLDWRLVITEAERSQFSRM